MTSVVFRVDSSAVIGSGHVMRCLTLAEKLRREGSRVLFVMREHPGHLAGIVAERGFQVAVLPLANVTSKGLGADGSWLGADCQSDAEETISAISLAGFTRPDWLIVDHYAIDQHWERALRPAVERMLVIDDLANRPHDCDALLDQNLVADYRSRYNDLLPSGTIRLLGPRYALLHPAYAELAGQDQRPSGPVDRVLIYFGAADAGLTLTALRALLSLKRGVFCDVVLSGTRPDRALVEELAIGDTNVTVHGQLASLAQLIAAADLAIGAGGATSWERLCLGLRSIVVTLAENQEPIARELHRLGLVNWIGGTRDVDFEGLRSAIVAEIDRGARRETFATVVDGRGVYRVGAFLSNAADISVRPAGPLDEQLLLDWANDPVTRLNAFSSAQIGAEGHHQWFTRRLGSLHWCRIYVAELADDAEIGQIRFENAEGRWYVHYSVAPEFRGRKLGAKMLNEAIKEFSGAVGQLPLRGEVLETNIASQRVFESLGFERLELADGTICYERPPGGL